MRPKLLSVLIGCTLAMGASRAMAGETASLDEALALAQSVRINDPEHHDAAGAAAALRPFADAGDSRACAALGYLSFLGYGMSNAQREKALHYMRCAADAGNPSAAFWVAGELLDRRHGTARTEAIRYLKIAVDGGHVGARTLLAGIDPARQPEQQFASAAVSQPPASKAVGPATMEVATIGRAVTRITAAETPIRVLDVASSPQRISHAEVTTIDVQAVELPQTKVLVGSGIGTISNISLPPVPIDGQAPDRQVAMEDQPIQAPIGNPPKDNWIEAAAVSEGVHSGAMAIPVMVATASAASFVADASAPTRDAERVIELEAKVRMMEEESNRRAAADRAEQLNRQGLDYLANGRAQEAASAFRQAVDLGSVSATTNLGLMFLTGDGVTADPAQAAQLLERSANSGNAVAAENLARMYELAIGVPKDTKQAIHWYERASLMGSARGTSALLRLKKGHS